MRKTPSLFQERYHPRPCPFCGGKAAATLFMNTVSIKCGSCGATVKQYVGGSDVDDILSGIDSVVAKWNARQ